MRSARCSARCAVSERHRLRRRWAGAALLAAAALAPLALPAQRLAPAGAAGVTNAAAIADAPAPTIPRADPALATSNPGAAPRVVVIDAGHGGRDPGKIGPNGLKEKDVALHIAQRVATVLR